MYRRAACHLLWVKELCFRHVFIFLCCLHCLSVITITCLDSVDCICSVQAVCVCVLNVKSGDKHQTIQLCHSVISYTSNGNVINT